MVKNLKNELKFFNHPEGYIEPDGFGNFDYIYQYKDHLGNIRLSYRLDGMGIDGFNNGTTGSWEAHSSTISNENDRLKVVLSDADVGVFKIVSAAAGETLAISLDVDKGTTDKVSLYEYGAGKLSDLVNGYNQISYTPTVSGDFILLIVKDPTSNDVGTQTIFYLDNIGVTVDEEELVIVEENNFYPFGMVQKGYNNVVNGTEHPFKYNGKELEEGLGLNLYEMDLRSYDPAIARFTSIDPVTHHSMSPYMAFDGNPVVFADPSGADAIQYDLQGRESNVNGRAISVLDRQKNAKKEGDFTSNTDPKQDKKKQQTNPNHPSKIDFTKDDSEILNSIVEWAIYIRENNEEKIYLSDVVVDVKKVKKRTSIDMLLDMGGNGTYQNKKTITDNEGNKLIVGFFRDYLRPNAFTDNSIIEVHFKGEIGQVGNSFRYDIQFKGSAVDNGVLPTLFYMNFIGKSFYDRVKDRIINPNRVVTIDGKQQGELKIPPKN